jgi:hypothetical protein
MPSAASTAGSSSSYVFMDQSELPDMPPKSHDQTFIENVCKELWMVQDGACKKHYGSVEDYKQLILKNAKVRLEAAEREMADSWRR